MMKAKDGRIKMAALAGLLLLALIAISRVLYLQRELTRQRQQAVDLQRRASASIAQMSALERELLNLEQRLGSASQRLARAEAQYDAERHTHDPLRTQIEKMTAESARFHQEAGRNRERIQELRKSLETHQEQQRKTETDRQALAAEKQDLLSRLKNMEAETQKAVETQSGLRDRLNAAEQQLVGLSNEVVAARAALENAFRTIAEQRKQMQETRPQGAVPAPPAGSGGTDVAPAGSGSEDKGEIP